MRVHTNRLLHWLLVISLAILPVRAVTAADMACEHDSEMQLMTGHGEHHAGMMQHADDTAMDEDSGHDCCCCKGEGLCSSDCGMGLHAAAIIPSAAVTANHFLPLLLAETSDSLHTRILTPPSRPPLGLLI